MKRLRIDVWIIALLVMTAAAAVSPAAQDGAETRPASSPAVTNAPVAAETAASADRDRRRGLASALAGRFEQAERYFRQAGDKKALQLLDVYVREQHRDEAGRVAEYAAAVRRVGQCMLAQKFMADLPKDNLAAVKKLRDHVKAAAEALGETITFSQALELATPDELSDLKDQADVKLKEATASLTAASKLLAGMQEKGEGKEREKYLMTLLSSLSEARIALANRRTAWAAVASEAGGRRHREVMSLQREMASLGEVMGEIESMVADKPWRRALMYGRIAVDLSIDSDRVERQGWYRSLIADAEARGARALGGAQWRDALAAYSGLKRLVPDNQAYKDSAKIAERHVRVLELYGRKEAPGASTRPSDGRRTWHDMVARVDEDMIKKVISCLARYYVTPVDYRKVVRGALLSVKVLAETPQAANAFPGLKNGKEVKELVRSIDAGLQSVRKRDRVDEMDLSLALIEVVDAASRTVHIPVNVLAVEFADGFLNELDRFSSMVWPYQVEDFDKNTMGRFFGIGVQISKPPGRSLKVMTPLAGAPAHRAGIKAGDSILAVRSDSGNWALTKDMTIDECVKRIMGKKGTKVVLRIKRRHVTKPFVVEVVRDEIRIHTVAGWRRLPGGGWDYMLNRKDRIGYIRIKQFTDTTAGDVERALMELRRGGMRSLVVDLRSNPGGLLRSAASVANQFLASGKIVSTKGRGGRLHSTAIRARPSGAYLEGDLVVLVDQHSASAAEIVSGALKELGRALIVGRRTYGKGSVQNVIPIPEHQASLKLTTAYYYVGNNEKLVHRRNGATEWGVSPHVVARMTPRQSRRWLSIRSRTDPIQDVDPKQLTGDLVDQYDSDIPLRTAVLLLRLRGIENAKHPA